MERDYLNDYKHSKVMLKFNVKISVHSAFSLFYNKSVASSKVSSPQSAI
jgi:hypothetical protein